MREQRSLTYVEIDVEYCVLSYGVAPCEAALGVTGDIKCFNTRKTCQDLENFNNATGQDDFGDFDITTGIPSGLTSQWSASGVSYEVQSDTITQGINLRSTGTNIGNMTGGSGLAAAFNDDTDDDAAASANRNTQTTAFVGKNFSTTRQQIDSVIVYGSNNDGFVNNINPSVTLQIRATNGSAPTVGTEGTLLGTTTFTDTNNENAGRTITITDKITAWQYVWCYITHNGAAEDVLCTELQLFEAIGGLAGAVADQEFKFRRTTDARTLVTFDYSAATGPGQEVVGSFYVENIQSGATLHGGVAVRASGAAATENAYVAGLKDTAATPNTFALVKFVAGVLTSLDTVSFTWATQTRYLIRLRAEGSAISAKVWATTDSEPDAWMLEATDASIPGTGLVGMVSFTDNDNPAFDYFASDLEGGTALLPTDDAGSVTLRFAIDTDYLPREIEAIPCIRDVSLSPATVSLGKDLGTRASLSVTLIDHPHSDHGSGFDKYVTERDYDPYERGTIFGKLRARQPYLRSKPIRIVRGLLPSNFADQYVQGEPLPDDILREQEVRHYVIESFDGPHSDGTYELVAKDTLKLASGDRAQAPILSNGFLNASITDSDTAATLTPAGIGDEEYPSSGYVAIGGNEIASFTRSSNTLTLTRGQLGTTAVAHNSGDRVQLVLRYAAEDPADIIYDLLVNYAGVNAGYISLTTWQTEIATFLNQVYTTTIGEPTSVETLISEMIEQAGLVLWWSDTDQLLKLQVLRGVSASATILDEGSIIEGSLGTREQPDLRLSQVWTNFAQINPLESVDEIQNYRSSAGTIDTDQEANYEVPAIKKIFSRWIPEGGRAVALALNDTLLSRYAEPPRRFNFELMRYNTEDIVLGGAYQLAFWPFQDATGDRENVACQVTRLDPRADRWVVEAEEMLFEATSEEQLAGRAIFYDSNTQNVNLRTTHDSLFGDINLELGSPTPVITCLVTSGVIIGSSDAGLPAFDVGTWPAGVLIYLVVRGRIQGCGGNGGDGGSAVGGDGDDGEEGGTALYTRYAIQLDSATGEIWSGGGGGGGGGGANTGSGGAQSGGGGGGGGAGSNAGSGGSGGSGVSGGGTGNDGDDGTSESSGSGGNGASSGADGGDGSGGGGPGEDGSNGTSGGGGGGVGSGGNGGDKGAAIDGVSFVTVSATGDHLGDEIN